jgi:biotin carboxyl carrier protein
VETVRAHCDSKNAYDLLVTDVLVTDGQNVTEGELLMTLEFYKVVSEIVAPVAGVVVGINAARGDEVQVGDALIEIEPA